jgi:hypothetical protein
MKRIFLVLFVTLSFQVLADDCATIIQCKNGIGKCSRQAPEGTRSLTCGINHGNKYSCVKNFSNQRTYICCAVSGNVIVTNDLILANKNCDNRGTQLPLLNYGL